MKKLLVLGMLSISAFAAEKDPRPDMVALASEITILQKYMLTDTDFAAPANEAQIKKSISTIDAHLGQLGKGTFANDPALKVNLSFLQQHIKDANRAFSQDGSKPFARYMLQSSLQMCIACHTRKKAYDFVWVEPEKNIAPMDKADFYFATRQFKKGKAIYEEVINNFPENKIPQWQVRNAMLALAVYYARVSEDPKGGAEYFKTVSAKTQLPAYLKEEMKNWSKEFDLWAKEKPAKEKAGELVLLAQAKKLLRHDDFSLVSELGRSFHVRRLRAATLLQEILESPGDRSPMKGQALLYLGQIYPRISSSLFFRFGEMYLKACVTEYPKTDVARSCYLALESIVTEGYSGSGGTNIPDDEQIELMRLKRLAY